MELALNPEQELTAEERSKVDAYKQALDFTSSNQVTQFGVTAQNKINSFADSALSSVMTKDMGEIGDILANLTQNVKKVEAIPDQKGGFFGLFDNIKKKIARMQAEYSKVEKNVSRIELDLQKHVQKLSKDIYVMDQQYKENWDYFREITLFIQAGDEKIKEMREVDLPKLEAEVKASEDPRVAQQYRDLEQQLNRFEKKVHDLKLTRTISIQLAPQIRLVQNNSALQVDKIQSVIANTLPLWKNQMVLALGIVHNQQALAAHKAVTDATNDLLKKNSEMLKQSTVQIAAESERGIVDIETIKQVNQDLFTTIDELQRIQKEGREKRIAAEVELKAIEQEMKNRLVNGKE